ncbi:MAG: TatD family hydrolase [Myxococcales bacterium]
MLVDIGCNLAHRSFGKDRDAILARAAAAGVGLLVITGTDLRASREACFLARGAPGRLFTTAGVHPHQAKSWDAESRAALREIARSREVVAVGECGLDFDRNFSPPAAQESCLHAQLDLAAELGKPVFLHERAASERFAAILAEHRARLAGGVVHCFTSDARALERYLAMDLHIGVTGWICDERRGRDLRQLIRRVPLERLMLETDAPFLLPPAARAQAEGGRRNEPAFLPHVLATVARARQEPEAVVAQATTATARAFFRLPE